VNVDFANPADGMEAARFSRNELHVFEEDRDHWKSSFLGDVVKPRLAGANANAIAARAFRKNDKVKLARCAAEVLEFANAARVEFAAFEKKADAAAENSLKPGGMPDGFIAQNQNWKTPGTPAETAEQNGVQQADVVADKEIPLLGTQPLQAVHPPQVGKREAQISAHAEH